MGSRTPMSPDPTIIPFPLIELGRLKQPPGNKPRFVGTLFSHLTAGDKTPPRQAHATVVSAMPATTPPLLIIDGGPPLVALFGPPNVPRSMSLYRVCCAAS